LRFPGRWLRWEGPELTRLTPQTLRAARTRQCGGPPFTAFHASRVSGNPLVVTPSDPSAPALHSGDLSPCQRAWYSSLKARSMSARWLAAKLACGARCLCRRPIPITNRNRQYTRRNLLGYWSIDSESCVVCVNIARLVHRLQHLASQEDHVRRQPAARGDPALHRHRIHRIQHQSCFAIGDGAALGTEIPSSVEAKRRAGGHADFVVRDRVEDDGAGRGTETVNDHGFAGWAKAPISVDVCSDPAAVIVRDPDYRMTCSHARKQQNRREHARD